MDKPTNTAMMSVPKHNRRESIGEKGKDTEKTAQGLYKN
jgi:hypothetical protein